MFTIKLKKLKNFVPSSRSDVEDDSSNVFERRSPVWTWTKIMFYRKWQYTSGSAKNMLFLIFA